MFLVGRLDLTERFQACPTFDMAQAQELILPDVELLHVMHEIDAGPMLDVLPSALHPSIPPAISWLFLKCPTSPAGPFSVAQTRIVGRFGVKPRAFLSGAYIDNPAAAELVTRHWGLPCHSGTIAVTHGYDIVRAEVTDSNGVVILKVDCINPDVYTGTVFLPPGLHLVRLDDVPHLLEVHATMSYSRIDRSTPHVRRFAPKAWGEPRLEPTTPISAFSAVGDLTLPHVDWSCNATTPEEVWIR